VKRSESILGRSGDGDEGFARDEHLYTNKRGARIKADNHVQELPLGLYCSLNPSGAYSEGVSPIPNSVCTFVLKIPRESRVEVVTGHWSPTKS
jgi:hypothetical protein